MKEHVRERDGEITVRIGRAVGVQIREGEISPFGSVCVWYMQGVLHSGLGGELQNQAVKWYEHGESSLRLHLWRRRDFGDLKKSISDSFVKQTLPLSLSGSAGVLGRVMEAKQSLLHRRGTQEELELHRPPHLRAAGKQKSKKRMNQELEEKNRLCPPSV